MKNLIVSPNIRTKLETKHNVTVREVEQCFLNRDGETLLDDDEDHRTDPPSWWFIAETNHGRRLQIIFVSKDGNIYLKSAFDPTPGKIRLYESKGYPKGDRQ